MPLALPIAGLVLLAALMHASWNALVKGASDRLLALLLVAAVPGLIGLFAGIFLLPLPARASWLFILLSMLGHGGYYVCLLEAYRLGDLSRVYPLARGGAPLLVAAVSALALGERLAPAALAGLLLITLGTASLAFEAGRPKGGDGRAMLFAGLTAITIAAYTLVDGLGARLSGAPFGYISWVFAADALPLVIAVPFLRGRAALPYLRRNWLSGAIGGLLSLAAYGIAIWAMTRGAMGEVAALRETGVIFAALIGTLALGEPFGRRRLAAASAVAAGIVLLGIGR
jgi:drug/metabolite transporter (DMT)-like permease